MRVTYLSSIMLLLLISGLCLAGESWPQFRGPTGQGLSDSTGLPVTWSETENVVWKTAIHDLGWSTPVILGDQVWVTTATPDGKDMWAVCLDRQSGEIVHDLHLFHNETVEPLGNDLNCYASPSAAIEPGRVYVHFGSYGTACIDTQTGKTLWERRDLPCRHYRGPGSSVIIYKNLLILTMDGVDQQYLVALDKTTGKTVWKTERTTKWTDLDPQGNPVAEGDYRKAYTTPIVIEVEGQPMLISPGAKAAFAYDPRDGKEIWTLPYTGFSNAASPLFAHGLLYINGGAGSGNLYAVRPNSKGEISDAQTAWKYTKNIGLKPSPVLVDDLLFLIDDGGVGTCLDARTGEEIWKKRVGGTYSASPVYADGKIYFANHEGKSVVIKPSKTYEVLAENQLEGSFMASPAIAGKSLFLRTKTHLYRIENK